MKTKNSRPRKLTAIIFFLVLTFVSCTKVATPKPSENPVMLTYEAQTKLITVKNLHNIERGYSTDKWVSDRDHLIIENDWIRFTQLGDDGIITRTVQIDVKENTTSQPRTHAIGLNSGTKGTILTVTQAGKP